MFSAEMINAILSEYRIKREAKTAAANAKRAAISEKIPALKPIDDELSSTGMRIFSAAMNKSVDLDSEMEKIRIRTAELKKQRAELLKANGVPEDFSEPDFDCKKCGDTGYINGKLCSCVTMIAAKRLFAQSGIGESLKEQTFDNFDLRLYAKKTDRDRMQKVLDFCRIYAENFSKNSESLLFSGQTGLGKTHLSSAIAQTVIQKGFSVMYESSQTLFDNFEASRFGREPEVDVKIYNECDLLIIDDLGAEHITQFTTSALFNLLNIRRINKRPMIISTNLPGKMINEKYNSRITSRLIGEFRVIGFCGSDIRMLKVKQP